MPKQTFTLENGKTVDLSWKAGIDRLKLAWRDFTIVYDGKIVGKEDDVLASLFAGRDYRLPDNSNLHVQLRNQLAPTLYLTHDGRPVSNSNDINTARLLLLLIGGVDIVFSFFGTAFDQLYTLVLGAILLTLGLLTPRFPRITLLIGMLVFVADAVLIVVFGAQNGTANPTFLIFRFLIIYFLYRGYKGIGPAAKA